MAVELRHLRYFVRVAENENVSRAALQLHVSQPALSRQIRDLESELGVLLLERTAKSVSLTRAGHVFLKEARAVLERADDAIRRARAIAAPAGSLSPQAEKFWQCAREAALASRVTPSEFVSRHLPGSITL